MHKRFDAKKLGASLSKLNHRNVVLFALSCAERLAPNYVAFSSQHGWGNPAPIRDALNLAWRWTSGEAVSRAQLEAAMYEADQCAPDTNDFQSMLVSPALDAAVSASLILQQILQEAVDPAVEVGRLACDTVDMYVQELERMPANLVNLNAMIVAHPLMQAELTRQSEALIVLNGELSFESAEAKWRNQESNLSA